LIASARTRSALAIAAAIQILFMSMSLFIALLWIRPSNAARRAFRQYPDRVSALASLGHQYLREKRNHEALAAFRTILSLHFPRDRVRAVCLAGMGKAYNRLEKHEEAVAVLERAVQLGPAFNEARLDLAEALIRQERYDEAIDLLNKAHEHSRERPRPLYLLGLAFEQKGLKEWARAYARHAVARKGDYAPAVKLLARLQEEPASSGKPIRSPDTTDDRQE
jgi:tetratricopeptide (TPR) repeat protein